MTTKICLHHFYNDCFIYIYIHKYIEAERRYENVFHWLASWFVRDYGYLMTYGGYT